MNKTTRFRSAGTGALALTLALAGSPANAQELEPYIGEIANFGLNFCPRGWAETSGQIISIAQNTALFSLLGTTYGGNGQTTFALPDLRGRTAIGTGQGPGLPFYSLGQVAGVENVTLTSQQMPLHSHSVGIRVSNTVGTVDSGARNTIAATAQPKYFNGAAPANFMDTSVLTLRQAGGSQPFGIRTSYLTTRYCIATEGIFPSRS